MEKGLTPKPPPGAPVAGSLLLSDREAMKLWEGLCPKCEDPVELNYQEEPQVGIRVWDCPACRRRYVLREDPCP